VIDLTFAGAAPRARSRDRPQRAGGGRASVSTTSWDDQRNRPMLAINEAMGFAKQPAWIGLEPRLRA